MEKIRNKQAEYIESVFGELGECILKISVRPADADVEKKLPESGPKTAASAMPRS